MKQSDKTEVVARGSYLSKLKKSPLLEPINGPENFVASKDGIGLNSSKSSNKNYFTPAGAHSSA